ncbi:hypothetical protein PV08_10498 [Exophiala spinifera]|uniref:Cupin type-2 domain-containing protein n=1 Tax=Exophiala spinifera TaxID=91928 RepID=A0A0D2AWW7_9EURO|nr:uncharacterized protein PV08_10498 [Exophiala spinifera]KIW11198.1 hypothetical protein PV08_10498 [Exophiala spinifera]
MSSLQTRRVVTGHSPEGKAIFEADEILLSLNLLTGKPISGSIAGIANIYKTENWPAALNVPFVDYYNKPLGLTDESGVICRVIHFPPVKDPAEDKLNILHRTQSLDFGVVLQGEIQLELDDGEKRSLKRGDVVVQRGTIHDWKNVSDQYCVMLFVLVPAELARVPETGKTLEPILPPMPSGESE